MEEIEKDKTQRARFFVKVISGEGEGQLFEIPSEGLLVGRSPDCDFVLENREISRLHARLYLNEGYCFIMDIGSRNGIVVGGKKARNRCLRNGDIIDFGCCKLEFHSEGSVKERPPRGKLLRLLENIEVLEHAPHAPRRLPLHPFSVAAVAFAALASWFWAFALGAVLLSVLALIEIRHRGRQRGKVLVLGALVLGISAGAINACARSGLRLPGLSKDPLTQQCRENFKRIAQALHRYAEDNEGRYPASLEDLYPEYVEDEGILVCPAAAARGLGRNSYYFPAAGQRRWQQESVVVLDRNIYNHDGRGGFVLRANGEVEWLKARDLQWSIIGLE